MAYDRKDLKEKVTTIDIHTKRKLRDINLDFLFHYEIFPYGIMKFKTQWDLEKRKIKMGDTIMQQAFLPPFSNFSLKIIFGVRINSIINEETRKGFSYQTIEGHVEKGESVFTVEEKEEALIFKIHTFSVPGNLLSKLAGPFFSLPYQAYCTRKALKNVQHWMEEK